MFDSTTIKFLVEAGSVGISFMLILALVIIIKGVLKMVGNHMSDYGKAMGKQAESNERLAQRIEDLINYVAKIKP